MAMGLQTTTTAAPAQGYPGMLDVAANHHIVTARNDDTVSIPFGKAVVAKAGATTDISASLPAGLQTQNVLGIVTFSQLYARAWTDSNGVVRGDVDATGLVPGTMMRVCRQGRILVTAASNVTAGTTKLYVRSVATLGETLGALEGAADASDMIDCSAQGTWISTATTGNLAWLEVNFR
jgi:hypothetical protein